jgi:hypothetical protein
MASSGVLRRVALIRTDVSEELSASIISVTRIGEVRKLAVTRHRRTLRRNTKFLYLRRQRSSTYRFCPLPFLRAGPHFASYSYLLFIPLFFTFLPIFLHVFPCPKFLCVDNEALRHEDVWGRGCVDPRILVLDTIANVWVDLTFPAPITHC